jgi:hypothetical protein
MLERVIGKRLWEMGKRRGNAWYVDEEERLVEMGYDVRSMKEWCVERDHRKGAEEVERTRAEMNLPRMSVQW